MAKKPDPPVASEGARMRAARTLLKLSQVDVAVRAPIPVGILWRIERGIRVPTSSEREAIWAVLSSDPGPKAEPFVRDLVDTVARMRSA